VFFWAASLTQVVNGFATTSILNTTEVELDVQTPVVELDEIGSVWEGSCSAEFERQDRDRYILKQLRVEHLNAEERKLLSGTCSEFSDIFYLPGDKLSSTGAAQHSIKIEPGT
jgi:hypothetical protein